jgi:hypothetical protein
MKEGTGSGASFKGAHGGAPTRTLKIWRARPAGIEPAAPRLGVLAEGATGGSATPLPLILLAFRRTPDDPRPLRAATDCHPTAEPAHWRSIASRSRLPRTTRTITTSLPSTRYRTTYSPTGKPRMPGRRSSRARRARGCASSGRTVPLWIRSRGLRFRGCRFREKCKRRCSGVCLLRQYATFAAIVHGEKTRAFFAKLVRGGFASAYVT